MEALIRYRTSDQLSRRSNPAETTEAFCDGHVSAFRYLGGVEAG